MLKHEVLVSAAVTKTVTGSAVFVTADRFRRPGLLETSWAFWPGVAPEGGSLSRPIPYRMALDGEIAKNIGIGLKKFNDFGAAHGHRGAYFPTIILILRGL